MTKKHIKEMDIATLVHYANKYRDNNIDSVTSSWLDDEEAERGNSANFRNNPELKQIGCNQDY